MEIKPPVPAEPQTAGEPEPAPQTPSSPEPDPGPDLLRSELGAVKRIITINFRSAFAQQIMGMEVTGVEIGSHFLFKTDSGVGLLPMPLLTTKLGGVLSGNEIGPDDPAFSTAVGRLGGPAVALVQVLVSSSSS